MSELRVRSKFKIFLQFLLQNPKLTSFCIMIGGEVGLKEQSRRDKRRKLYNCQTIGLQDSLYNLVTFLML